MLNPRNYDPALMFGGKLSPTDIQSLLGLPYVGNIIYVDPTNGSDTGGNASTIGFKTLAAAYAAAADNSHDVIVIKPAGTGSGTGTVETTAITWSKNLIHLVGNVVGGPYSSRARVTTATAGLSPWITVSGSGNSFHNVMFQSNATTNLIVVRVSGDRNVFDNCHIGNINATAADSVNVDLDVYGAEECLFNNCVIGFDTYVRTAAGANVRLIANATDAGAATRDIFRNCIFPMFADADAPKFVIASGASCIDRQVIFDHCMFLNATGSTSTAQTDAFAVNASPGGHLVLQDCLKIGATGWADNLTNLYLLGDSSNATYANGIGFAVNPGA